MAFPRHVSLSGEVFEKKKREKKPKIYLILFRYENVNFVKLIKLIIFTRSPTWPHPSKRISTLGVMKSKFQVDPSLVSISIYLVFKIWSMLAVKKNIFIELKDFSFKLTPIK